MTRSSRTRYAVLGMLADGPRTGYTLREEINASIGHFWHESDGQLYPTLRDLAVAGLIRTTAQPGRGRGRAIHELLPDGLSALRVWLAEDPGPGSSARNELLLQLFFGRHAGPGMLEAKLDRHQTTVAGLAKHFRSLEASVAADPSPDRGYWLATLRHGVLMADAQLAWVAEARALLAERSTP